MIINSMGLKSLCEVGMNFIKKLIRREKKVVEPESSIQPKGAKATYFKDNRGLWRWNVVAANSKIICTPGESFSSKAKAEKNFARVTKFFKEEI